MTRLALRELELKRTFLRYIGHEVRTPLNVALVGIHCLDIELSKIESPATLMDISRELKRSCTDAVDILNDMLTLEKAEAGLLELFPSTIEVMPFVEGIVRAFDLQVI